MEAIAGDTDVDITVFRADVLFAEQFSSILFVFEILSVLTTQGKV